MSELLNFNKDLPGFTQAHETVCNENERNKQRKMMHVYKTVIDERKLFYTRIRHTQGTGMGKTISTSFDSTIVESNVDTMKVPTLKNHALGTHSLFSKW